MKPPKLHAGLPPFLRQVFKMLFRSGNNITPAFLQDQIAEIKKGLPPDLLATFSKPETLIRHMELHGAIMKSEGETCENCEFLFKQGIEAGAHFILECWKLSLSTPGPRQPSPKTVPGFLMTVPQWWKLPPAKLLKMAQERLPDIQKDSIKRQISRARSKLKKADSKP